MEHTIINHSHHRNFTVIPNDLLQATDISPYALGILCHLLSLPGSWTVSAAKLAERFGEKEVRIIRALNDLIGLGYCKRVPYRSEGRLRGQQYYITDVRGDFSEPTIFEATEKAGPQKLQTSENSDPHKNRGSEKNKEIGNKVTISNKENKEGDRSTDEPLCLFANSRFADFDLFCQQFSGDDFAGVNLRHYYEAVKNWSASKRIKRNDWIATARGWMFRDDADGKLVKVSTPAGLTQDQINYLQMGWEADELWPEN